MKKNTTAFSAWFVAVLFLMVMASPLCPAGELQGTWSAENVEMFGEKGSIRVVFNEDGTALFVVRLKSRKSEEIFNYRLENGTLYFLMPGEIFNPDETAEIYFQFIGDKLRLDMDEPVGTLLLDRVGEAPRSGPGRMSVPSPETRTPPSEPAGGDLVGVWTSGPLPGNRDISFVFDVSGAVEIIAVTNGRSNTNRGTFQEKGNQILIVSDAGKELSIPKRWQGDTLCLTVDGEEIELTREDGADIEEW